MLNLLFGLGIATLIYAVFLGWLALLIIGIVKCFRRKKHGKTFIVAGSVWGLLAMLLLIGMFWNIRKAQRYDPPASFDAAEYDGETGTLALPYDGKGKVWFYDDDEFKTADITGGKAVLPAKEIRIAHISFGLKTTRNKWLFMSIDSFADGNRVFTIAPDAVLTLPGGPPLTASIKVAPWSAERATEHSIELDLILTDSAGNELTVQTHGKPFRFEAISPYGNCFWRGKFKNGFIGSTYQGKIPKYAPHSFTLRPVLPNDLPFEVRRVDTPATGR